MIRFEQVSKRFPGQSRPAVDAITFQVPAGATCVLIGPSGCGKTTTLKMINRLVEPTSGHIYVDGRDVQSVSAVELRRGIGYVIQQVGLFPHMTVLENVATVPRLLGWEARKTRSRAEELLALVGLDPQQFRGRYPRELSGGQRQRVGVARALAADPPVMLMDEPFGAIDPIARERLQDEFLRIQRQIRKTIVFVTHDVDEALKMGDLIGIMDVGQFVQIGSPTEVLAHPASPFVSAFLGADSTLKLLELLPVASVLEPGQPKSDGAYALSAGDSLRAALSLLLAHGLEAVAVRDASGAHVGRVTLEAIRRTAATEQSNPTAVNASD